MRGGPQCFGISKLYQNTVYVTGSTNSNTGYGTTNSKIRCFKTLVTQTGTAIAYSSDAVFGDRFTITEDGVYAVTYKDTAAGSATYNFGISLNTTQIGTVVTSVTDGSIIALEQVASTVNVNGNCVIFVPLLAGSVLRAHTDSAGSGNLTGAANCSLRITKIS